MVDSPDIIPSRSAAGEAELGLPGLGEAPAKQAVPAQTGAYRVLARKYRPRSFSELIGQDAMVRTLANAIRRGRLAHAFLMTGVRGVGKTSTARLIAKALNCVGPDGNGGPTIDPCGLCEHCRAISEGRDIDVVEMDAASHRGIDDVREINEASRYSAVSARYKIYIIDEVHMLTKEAFNALLKTLEEPPAHVKFLFATTEVEKLPVTVLSRCQRFDLKRVPVEQLARHFASIAEREQVPAEPEALGLIAEAAEGSVRDGLSILDQAIAHAELADGQVAASAVREMLGLSDRSAVRRLLAAILEGDAPAVIARYREQYRLGVEPAQLVAGLMGQLHAITLAKVGAVPDAALDERARDELGGWAERLGHAQLHRLWQLLERGLEEVRRAANATQACEMALLRCVHAATLPDPGELARLLQGTQQAPAMSQPPGATEPAPSPAPASFAALLDRLGEYGFHNVETVLRDSLRLVAYEPPVLRFQWADPVPAGFSQELARALRDATGMRWTLELSPGDAQPSGRERERAAAEGARAAALASPVVQAALAAFPGARLIDEGDVSPIPRSASA